jgi:hypothetical protein
MRMEGSRHTAVLEQLLVREGGFIRGPTVDGGRWQLSGERIDLTRPENIAYLQRMSDLEQTFFREVAGKWVHKDVALAMRGSEYVIRALFSLA